MKTSIVVEVIDDDCIGCKQCDQVCPTGAIVTIDRLARVNEDICTGCAKCIEACMDHGAIKRKRLSESQAFELEVSEAEKPRVGEICKNAHLEPDEVICMCTEATAGQVAAAIIRGAKTPEDVAIMSGARAICAIWCSSPVMRLLQAANIPQERSPKDWRVYVDTGLEVGIWNVSDEIAEKYPEYRIKENKERLKSNKISIPLFADIARIEE